MTDIGCPALPARAPAAFGAFPFGFGVFPLCGEARPSEDDAVRVILTALDTGVRFVDTADSYHSIGEAVGFGERLVARALREWGGDAADVLVGTKGSRILGADGERVSDGRPEHIRAANANPDEIRLAIGMLGDALVAVQNQFGPGFHSSEPELELCEAEGLVFLPWSAFGGTDPEISLDVTFPELTGLAADYGVSWFQVVLAWLRSRSPVVLPIPGARRLSSLTDSLTHLRVFVTSAPCSSTRRCHEHAQMSARGGERRAASGGPTAQSASAGRPAISPRRSRSASVFALSAKRAA